MCREKLRMFPAQLSEARARYITSNAVEQETGDFFCAQNARFCPRIAIEDSDTVCYIDGGET